jgi:hypothetical protein
MCYKLEEDVRWAPVPWANSEIDELTVDPDGPTLVPKVGPVVVRGQPDLGSFDNQARELAEVTQQGTKRDQEVVDLDSGNWTLWRSEPAKIHRCLPLAPIVRRTLRSAASARSSLATRARPLQRFVGQLVTSLGCDAPDLGENSLVCPAAATPRTNVEVFRSQKRRELLTDG